MINEIVEYKGRCFDPRKKIIVYRNLNHKKSRLYSIKQDGQVKAHATSITLKDCSFKVNLKGINRIRDRKSREVVAYAEGYLDYPFEGDEMSVSILFNPYKYDGFVTIPNEELVSGASKLLFNQHGSTGEKTF